MPGPARTSVRHGRAYAPNTRTHEALYPVTGPGTPLSELGWEQALRFTATHARHARTAWSTTDKVSR